MSTNRKMYQEEVVHVHNGILAMKKHGTVPLPPLQKDLEIITQLEERNRKTDIL